MDSKDVILGIVGFILSFYGSQTTNQTVLIMGLSIILLTIWLNLQGHEEDIKIIKAQINTQNELKRLWREIDVIKDDKLKKR